MTEVEILLKARDRIAQSRDHFICRAVESVIRYQRHETKAAGKRVIAHIEALLYPYRTYGTWLKKTHPRAFNRYTNEEFAWRNARLVWINDMIKYWENKQ
jgi:hypothetical protein